MPMCAVFPKPNAICQNSGSRDLMPICQKPPTQIQWIRPISHEKDLLATHPQIQPKTAQIKSKHCCTNPCWAVIDDWWFVWRPAPPHSKTVCIFIYPSQPFQTNKTWQHQSTRACFQPQNSSKSAQRSSKSPQSHPEINPKQFNLNPFLLKSEHAELKHIINKNGITNL